MVSITCKYLGAENLYIDGGTTWSLPCIRSLDDCPSLRLDYGNQWWQTTLELYRRCIEQIELLDLECFMSLPDLNGPSEVLSGLRGPQELCIDLLENPAAVKRAAAEVQKSWFDAWKGLVPLSNRYGGYFTWMGIWSSLPAVDSLFRPL